MADEPRATASCRLATRRLRQLAPPVLEEERMNKFEVISKLWPSGVLLNGGVDVNTVNPPGQVFTRTAPPLAPGTGAPNGYRFLFWNTGRRVTNKHQVTWTFNNLSSWTTWTATRWYGIAGGGGTGGSSSKLITASAFATEDDASMTGTPIDPTNSTFTDGSGGQTAYPFGTPPDDHVASTQWGPASVAALDPYPPQMVFNEYHLVGWLRLVLGGDETGQFDETDGAAIGGPSYYSYLDASPVSIAKDDTVDLMAAYRVVRISPPGVPELIPIDYITFIEWLLDYDRLIDPRPSPMGTRTDRLRVGALTDLVALTRMAEGPEDLLKSLKANVKLLSPAELKRAISSAKAIGGRVEEATKALEAAMAKGRKSGKT